MSERKYARLNLTAAGNQVIEADLAGFRVEVYVVAFDVSAATALPAFKDAAGGTVIAGQFDSTGPHFFGTRDTLFRSSPGKGLVLETTGAGNVRGFIAYRVVPN